MKTLKNLPYLIQVFDLKIKCFLCVLRLVKQHGNLASISAKHPRLRNFFPKNCPNYSWLNPMGRHRVKMNLERTYSRGLYSWKIFNREYQNCNFNRAVLPRV